MPFVCVPDSGTFEISVVGDSVRERLLGGESSLEDSNVVVSMTRMGGGLFRCCVDEMDVDG